MSICSDIIYSTLQLFGKVGRCISMSMSICRRVTDEMVVSTCRYGELDLYYYLLGRHFTVLRKLLYDKSKMQLLNTN